MPPGGIKVKTRFLPTTYQCLSTQEKPFPGSISTPASLLEIDTGRVFHWTGTTWVEQTPEVQELREIKGLLGAILERMDAAL